MAFRHLRKMVTRLCLFWMLLSSLGTLSTTTTPPSSHVGKLGQRPTKLSHLNSLLPHGRSGSIGFAFIQGAEAFEGHKDQTFDHLGHKETLEAYDGSCDELPQFLTMEQDPARLERYMDAAAHRCAGKSHEIHEAVKARADEIYRAQSVMGRLTDLVGQILGAGTADADTTDAHADL